MKEAAKTEEIEADTDEFLLIGQLCTMLYALDEHQEIMQDFADRNSEASQMLEKINLEVLLLRLRSSERSTHESEKDSQIPYPEDPQEREEMFRRRALLSHALFNLAVQEAAEMEEKEEIEVDTDEFVLKEHLYTILHAIDAGREEVVREVTNRDSEESKALETLNLEVLLLRTLRQRTVVS